MATIPTSEPAFLQAGDTLSWQRTLADYPASSGWVLSYRFINSAARFDITAAASGADHLVTVDAATSAAYAAGDYTWQAVVTKATERYTIGSGRATVRHNLAGMTSNYDARSTAARALDDLRIALAGWLTSSGTVQEYEIAGRRMKFASAADIQQRIALAEREVARETAAANLAAGISAGRRVLVRF
jgi:hypothetical protein